MTETGLVRMSASRRMSRLFAGVVVVAAALLTGCQWAGTTGPRTALIGDSVTNGASREISSAVVATPARFLAHTANAQRVAEMLPALTVIVGERPARLVVALGANDAGQNRTAAQMRADIRRFAGRATADGACVRWLNLPTDVTTPNLSYRPAAARFNTILADETARLAAAGRDIAVADFDRWARRHPAAMFGDGLHIDPAGRPVFARWVATVANRCA